MKRYIALDDVRELLCEALNERKISNPRTEIGFSFNDGIEVAIMTVDTYLYRLKSLGRKEDSSDD